MQSCQFFILPYELVAQCLNELPLSMQLSIRSVCKQFQHLINDLDVRHPLVNCKVKDYVKTVEKKIPSFIRHAFTVSDFAKIAFQSISSIESNVAPSIEAQCRGKSVIGNLNKNEYFFTFPCKQVFKEKNSFITIVFYSVQNGAFWHYAAIQERIETSDYTPLRTDIESYGESSRYYQYKQMLTQIFQKKEWRQFSKYTNNQSNCCILEFNSNFDES